MSYKKILLGIGLFFVISSSSAWAADSYPIPELGNCRNQSECFRLCELPQNHAWCESFAKKMKQNQVLGKTTVTEDSKNTVNYPIAELGTCADKKACFVYCHNPMYRTACISFAQQHDLPYQKSLKDSQEKIMKDLGCPSRNVCLSVCERPENRTRCQELAKKYGIE